MCVGLSTVDRGKYKRIEEGEKGVKYYSMTN